MEDIKQNCSEITVIGSGPHAQCCVQLLSDQHYKSDKGNYRTEMDHFAL